MNKRISQKVRNRRFKNAARGLADTLVSNRGASQGFRDMAGN
jgi:hypothetical protein